MDDRAIDRRSRMTTRRFASAEEADAHDLARWPEVLEAERAALAWRLSEALYHRPMSLEGLRARRREILELAARHGVRNPRVFGSVARGEESSQSDVDILVDVDEGRSLLDVIALEQALEDLLGCAVQIVSRRGLSPYLRSRILAEATAL